MAYYKSPSFIAAAFILFCMSSFNVLAETYPTNWWSNQTSQLNMYTEGGENVRLHNACYGYIEGTVSLPRDNLWQIGFYIKVDGEYNHPDDYAKAYINSELIADVPNIPHGDPLSWLYHISHQVNGDTFTYRFEIYSHYCFYHAHLAIGPGTATSVYLSDGFEPPMDGVAVSVKKNRVLPLKVKLFRNDGTLVTNLDVTSPPVLQVRFVDGEGEATDVTDDALPAGMGTDGNVFSYSDDGKWQYNLKTSNYTAPGTYFVEMVSGDTSEYLLSNTIESSFVIRSSK